MAYREFRSFIEALRDDDDLLEVNTEVDPDGEIGAVCRKAGETRQKAILFNNVRGNHEGLLRVLGAPGGLRKEGPRQYGRVAMHFGLPSTATAKDIFEKLMSVDLADPVPPRVVETGPCKENILRGSEIDLTKIPVPLLHGHDGGRYIQTYGMHIVQTPDKSWTNWSIARAMVYDKNRLTGLVAPFQHIGMIHGQWKARGQDTPWALALGVPPTAIAVSGMPIPENVDESGYIGALNGAPVEVVKCECNDLYVPATSEIVLEGTISATETVEEGPMGEMFGLLFPNKKRQSPVFHVNVITYRNNAILPVAVAGRSPEETHTIFGFLATAAIAKVCKEASLPIKQVWVPHQTSATWIVLQVDVKALSAGGWKREDFCRQVGEVAFHSHSTAAMSRILLVGDDIDPTDFEDVLWAFHTRCRPGQDEYIFEDVLGFPLLPFMGYGPGDPLKGGKVVSDCLFTEQYTNPAFDFTEASFRGGYSEDVKDLVNRRWTTVYGFTK